MTTEEAVAAIRDVTGGSKSADDESGTSHDAHGIAFVIRLREVVARVLAGASGEALGLDLSVSCKAAPHFFEIRPAEEHDRALVEAGLSMDREVGDVAFDGAFAVDVTPRALASELLTSAVRARLVSLHPVTVRHVEGLLQIHRPAPPQSGAEVKGLVELALQLAEELPAALARADEASDAPRDPYRGGR